MCDLIVSYTLQGREGGSDCAFAVLRQRRACGPAHGFDDVAPRVVLVLPDRAKRIDRVAQSILRIVGVPSNLIIGVVAVDRSVDRGFGVFREGRTGRKAYRARHIPGRVVDVLHDRP